MSNLQGFKRRHGPTSRHLMFVSNGDSNGVIHHLGTMYGSQNWINPIVSGMVQVNSYWIHLQHITTFYYSLWHFSMCWERIASVMLMSKLLQSRSPNNIRNLTLYTALLDSISPHKLTAFVKLRNIYHQYSDSERGCYYTQIVGIDALPINIPLDMAAHGCMFHLYQTFKHGVTGMGQPKREIQDLRKCVPITVWPSMLLNSQVCKEDQFHRQVSYETSTLPACTACCLRCRVCCMLQCQFIGLHQTTPAV